jgi:hypothetical protein
MLFPGQQEVTSIPSSTVVAVVVVVMEVVTSEKIGFEMCCLLHCGGSDVEVVGSSFTSTWLMDIP